MIILTILEYFLILCSRIVNQQYLHKQKILTNEKKIYSQYLSITSDFKLIREKKCLKSNPFCCFSSSCFIINFLQTLPCAFLGYTNFDIFEGVEVLGYLYAIVFC